MAKSLRVILVALLVLGAGGSAAWAGQGPTTPVPIKGSFEGVDWVDFDAPGCPDWAEIRFYDTGTGTMSHLGKVDYLTSNCTSVSTGRIEGTVTFTAANGDVLVIEHTGTPDIAPDWLSVTTYYEWTVVDDDDGHDSTGRFDGATGSGTSLSEAGIPPAPEVSEFWLDGTITYDASNRSNR